MRKGDNGVEGKIERERERERAMVEMKTDEGLEEEKRDMIK